MYLNVKKESIINYTQKPQLIRKPRIATLKPLTFGFVLAAVLCNYDRAIAQTFNHQTLPPSQIEDTPVISLRSDVLAQSSDQNQLLPSPQVPDQPTLKEDDPNAKFRVDRIEVLGNTVFKPEDFAPITAPFVGREVSFAELLQIKDAISKLYTDKGYVTTGALIIPQTVEAGVIKIQVVEGSLQEIKIVGNRRLRSQYIRDRIRLGAGKPLNVPRFKKTATASP